MKKLMLLVIVLIFMGIDDATSQWAINGNHIYNTNTGFVGIGTNAPTTLLHVAKNTTEPAISVQNLGGAGGATYNMIDAVSGAYWKFKATNSGGFKVRDQANSLDVMVIEPNSSANAIYINSSGYIGLGTNSPSANLHLHVSGTNAYAGLMISSNLYGAKNLSINQGTAGQLNFTEPWVVDLVTMDFNTGNVGIGNTNPDASAALDISSSTKGFLTPRMTSVEMSSISNPTNGLLVFNTTDNKFYAYLTSTESWKELLFGSSTVNMNCGILIIDHTTAGGVAPVNKTVNYGTVIGVAGEIDKCWLAQNLGADNQASSVNDVTEAAAGWYWQFNQKRGFKHDGTTLTPAWTITSINESSSWSSANDPCALELGGTWRMPTMSEWYNVDYNGSWEEMTDPYNSPLKMHAAGYLHNTNGYLISRGSVGSYWSNTQENSTNGYYMGFFTTEFDSFCDISNENKALGMSVRCIK
jgi:hypothetical protein